MMQKRLRYSMPRKPLSEYNLDNTADDNGAHQEDVPIVAAGNQCKSGWKNGFVRWRGRNVKFYRPPAERPLAGDLESI